MPIPPAIAPFLAPGAMAAAKQMAFSVAWCLETYFYTLTSVTLTAIMVRRIWKRLPNWIKQDVSFQNLIGGSGSAGDKDTREELSHLGSVIEKLQALTEESTRDMEHVPNIHAAILAFVQLTGQLKLLELKKAINSASERSKGDSSRRTPCPRDVHYQRAGKPIPMSYLQGNPEYRRALNFATWAYYADSADLTPKLEDEGYSLLEHYVATLPGYVSYYIAVSSRVEKQLVIGVKGTTSLEEILTDCCGRAVSWHNEASDGSRSPDVKTRIEVKAKEPPKVSWKSDGQVEILSGHERVWMEEEDDERCHEGILLSARRLVEGDNVLALIESLVVQSNYRLVLCGHSLGAGAAVLCGVLLRERFPSLVHDLSNRRNNKMHVYAFAPPPVLDHDSAVGAACFCTSIVNNADVIPRASLQNLMVSLEFLRTVQQRLDQEGLNPVGLQTTAAFLTKLCQGISDQDLLLSPEQVTKAWKAAHATVEMRKPGHLYVPGRVYLVYQPWVADAEDETEYDDDDDVSQWVSSAASGDDPAAEDSRDETEQDPRSQQQPDDDDDDSDWIAREEAQGMDATTFCCVQTDGTAPVLSLVEVDGVRMFTDHVCSSYYELLGISNYPF